MVPLQDTHEVIQDNLEFFNAHTNKSSAEKRDTSRRIKGFVHGLAKAASSFPARISAGNLCGNATDTRLFDRNLLLVVMGLTLTGLGDRSV